MLYSFNLTYMCMYICANIYIYIYEKVRLYVYIYIYIAKHIYANIRLKLYNMCYDLHIL
jgi:hypothetical protein